MKALALTVAVFSSLLLLSATAEAQTVTYTTTTTVAPLATVQAWVATLYVNTSPVVLTQTCTAALTVITCTAPLPNISTLLTATGNQTFVITWKDPVLGESPQSSPLVLVRPSAPTTLVIR